MWCLPEGQITHSETSRRNCAHLLLACRVQTRRARDSHHWQRHSVCRKVLSDILAPDDWHSVTLSTAYHPQTDGQTERTNRVLECYLCTFVNPSRDDRDLYLPAAAFASNNSYHTSISSTPFFLNNGRHPRMPFAAEIDRTTQSHVPAASNFASNLHETLKRA